MSKNHKYLKPKPVVPRKQKITFFALSAAIVVVVLLIALLLILMGRQEEPDITEPTIAGTSEAATEPTTQPTEEVEVPTETERVMLPHMKELYDQNPDIIGWIKIEETKLDYPVMWTPNDKWKYDHLSFDQKYDFGGVPYLNEECDVDLPTTNLLIYGHNMTNGSQFRTIMYYQQMHYWKQHPTISFTTLYEEREYEVLAAFYDRIYYKAENCFKYYNFINPETEEEFNEGIDYFKSHSLYDTGVDAEFGDQLLTLVTCAYHVEDGRFVVVAKLIEDEPAEETTAPTENEA